MTSTGNMPNMNRKRIQVAHEAPLALMPLVRHFTDYDYALVHLFEDPDRAFAKEYYHFFETSLKRGRRVILDNSVFELGEAFDLEKFFEWVYKLQPTEYIIPDALEDYPGTIKKVDDWLRLVEQKAEEGRVLKSKSIGVCQGKTYADLFLCYKALSYKVDKIAVSFDCSCYLECFSYEPKEEGFMNGRKLFMTDLRKRFRTGAFEEKPMHLLGCFLPQEFVYYKENPGFSFIETLDTSNPVVHGLIRKRYGDNGLYEKCMTKLVTFMKLPATAITDTQKAVIFSNITKFKNWI